MGTMCELTVSAPNRTSADRFFEASLRWVAAFESKYSRFLPGSLISRINAAAGLEWVNIDPETDQILGLCQELFFLTRRAFDPTAMPLIRLWNWKAQPVVIPTDAQIAEARQLTGWNQVQRRPGAIFLPRKGMCLDLGGVGKEYAVDRVVQLAAQQGIRDVLVNFGQDIFAAGAPSGAPAWHVGLEDPKKPGSCWTGVAATNVAVATSGDYVRRFEHNGRRYGHIIDPRTGYPVDNGCRAVSVIAPTCTVAGVLSTTAFILGHKEGLEMISSYHGASGCIVTDHQRYETRQFAQYLTR
jgi:thiamine biosynthesis lipoprotein